ncbi:MAG: MFS transporter, partial [Serratia proteamaculans]
GNLIASVNATLQATIAEHHGHNYGLAMAIIAGTVAIVIALLVFLGKDTGSKAISGEAKSSGVQANV